MLALSSLLLLPLLPLGSALVHPDGLIRIGILNTLSPLVTHTGEWTILENDTHIANATETPATTLTSGTLSFSAAGTGAVWDILTLDRNTTYKQYIDGIPYWTEPMDLEEGMRDEKTINATTQFGWHNYTLEIVGKAQVTRMFLDTMGRGGFTPSTDGSPATDKADSTKLGSWLSLANKDNWQTYEPEALATNVKGETATIRPPKGTKHVVVRTYSRANFGAYTVKITPDPAVGPAERSYGASGNLLTVMPLLLADLNPKQQYEITVTNDGDGEVGIMSATFTKAGSSKVKVIVPAVVVPVVVVAALIGAFFWWRRRKAAKRGVQHREETELKSIVKENDHNSEKV